MAGKFHSLMFVLLNGGSGVGMSCGRMDTVSLADVCVTEWRAIGDSTQ